MSLLPTQKIVTIDWQQVKVWRELHRISRNDLATLLAVSPKFLEQWEEGQVVPNDLIESRVSKIFKVLFNNFSKPVSNPTPSSQPCRCQKFKRGDVVETLRDWVEEMTR